MMVFALKIGILRSSAISQKKKKKDLKQSGTQVPRVGCKTLLLKASDTLQ
jgi:hypothetical protein